MTALPDSRAMLERWPALVVRYWAANMTLIHDRGQDWPGFGYTDDEKQELRTIAAKFSLGQYFAWVAIVAVIAIAIFGVIAFAGMSCLTYAIGGAQNMANTPAPLFYLAMGLIVVVSLSIGFPAAMLPSSALVGRWFKVADADLPDRTTTAHYFHKLWFQITRIAVVMLCLLFPLWLFVPWDSKFMVMARLIMPLVSPVVLAITTTYYFSARLQRKAAQSE